MALVQLDASLSPARLRQTKRHWQQSRSPLPRIQQAGEKKYKARNRQPHSTEVLVEVIPSKRRTARIVQLTNGPLPVLGVT